jgi:hypothetical protein
MPGERLQILRLKRSIASAPPVDTVLQPAPEAPVIEWVDSQLPGNRRCPVVTGVGIYAPNSTQLVRAQFADLGIIGMAPK